MAGACGGGAGGGRCRGGAGGARPAAPRPSCCGASCEQGAWSVVFEFWRAVYRAACGHEKRRKCAQLLRFELSVELRGREERTKPRACGCRGTWATAPWNRGAHVFVYRDLPSDATWQLLASLAPSMLPGCPSPKELRRGHPHMLPTPEENENRTQSTATMKQANSTVFATTLPNKVWV